MNIEKSDTLFIANTADPDPDLLIKLKKVGFDAVYDIISTDVIKDRILPLIREKNQHKNIISTTNGGVG